MVEINSSTKVAVKKKTVAGKGKGGANAPKKANASAGGRRGKAPLLKPATLQTAAAIAKIEGGDGGRRAAVEQCFRRTVGQSAGVAVGVDRLAKPHVGASTTRDRAGAAADVAVLAREWGLLYVLKECHVLNDMSRILFPMGIEELFGTKDGDATIVENKSPSGEADNNNNDEASALSSTIKPSNSAVSLTSLGDDSQDGESGIAGSGIAGSVFSGMSDGKRGRTTPPDAREGCLLLLRALAEIVGKPAEPFVVGAFLSVALMECGSSNGSIREAAEDTSTALITLAHPYAFPSIISPLLVQALQSSTEWRVKTNILGCIQQCASTTATKQVQTLIPQLIPVLTNQVWDTKPQVSKAARSALLAVCDTNTNADVKPAIPAVVNAICKPADTTKAVSSLMHTTFIVPVDASTLAILCPVLARALKEKLAIHKRSACLVISNMSKLVETPQAVAPFGSLLVPELQKVANNVQFEEIRDEALKALANLTKALGDSYKADENNESSMGTASTTQSATLKEETLRELEAEKARVEAEQEKIRKAREEEAAREAEIRRKEEEERKRFKEAMDAQRQLDKAAEMEAKEQRKAKGIEREKQRLSTKGATGKCQGCGLKKCPKSCMFYGQMNKR